MYDPAEVFERKFTPVEGGYVYYPSKYAEGKLIAPDEYDALLKNWTRVAGFKGIALMVSGMFAWAVACVITDLPIFVAPIGGVGLMFGYVLIVVRAASLAPRRLVEDRKATFLARSKQEYRRAARRQVPWALTHITMFMSGFYLLKTFFLPEANGFIWAVRLVLGLILASGIWQVVRRLNDHERQFDGS